MFLPMIYTVLLLLVFYLYNNLRRKSNKYSLPPGPPSLPLIGSLLSLIQADKRPAVAFEILGKKYGPLFSVKLGSTTAVVLTSHALMKEVAFSEDLLSHLDESDIWLLEKSEGLSLGLFNGIPGLWNHTRNFCQKILRNHGFNEKSKITSLIIDEFADFCDELKDQMTNGQLRMTMTTQFNHVFHNIVWTIATGKKYGASDPKTKPFLEAINIFMRSNNFGGNISSIFPQLCKIFPTLTGFTAHKERCSEWRRMVKEAILEHRLGGANKDCPINFLDEYLHKIDSVNGVQDVRKSVFTEDNLVAVLQDLAAGGTDTQSNLMKLLIRYMLKNLEIQKKLQKEVDEVVGYSRLVIEDDIPKLIYLQATMYELYRLGNTVPVLPRKLLNDWKFRNYLIPKGSLIMLNIWTGDKDPDVWENPTKFDPTRFLSPKGELINTEKILSFGFGKRRCIGEQLAKTNMILATTTLIQNFSFHLDPEYGVPCDGDIHGFTRDIVPFNVIVKCRYY